MYHALCGRLAQCRSVSQSAVLRCGFKSLSPGVNGDASMVLRQPNINFDPESVAKVAFGSPASNKLGSSHRHYSTRRQYDTGCIVAGDIINFKPKPTAEDPTGCLRLNEAFARSVEKNGMTVMHRHSCVFPDDGSYRPGFTSVVLIDASHCTAHCYSDTEQISIDVFTCGKTSPSLIYDDAIQVLKEMSPTMEVVSENKDPRFLSERPNREPQRTITDFAKRHYKHFNAATVVEAAEGWRKHVVECGGKMMLTLAGAMSTAELGISVAELIRQDMVHGICCTGANLEEDFFNLVAHDAYYRIPDWRNLTKDDDQRLHDEGYNRVTDTCIPESEAVRRIEKELLALYKELVASNERLFPYELFYALIRRGSCQQSYQVDPRDSWLIAAAEKDLPIWTPGWEDSTCANMLAANFIKGELATMPMKSGVEQMVTLCEWYQANHQAGIGFFQVGGGIAGDFPICAVPLLRQDLGRDVNLWSYFCQISEACTSYGGYSGAPASEKISWGKLSAKTPSFQIESDATIVFPIIAAIVLGQ